MRRGLLVAFAFAASVLLVTAPVGSATQGSDELVVGAKQTTASDFAGASLTNMSVTEAGSGASVTLDSGGTVDDFDSATLSNYGGSTGSASIQSTIARSGSALEISSSGGDTAIASTSGLSHYPPQGSTWTTWTRLAEAGSRGGVLFGTQSASNPTQNTYAAFYNADSGNLVISKWVDGSYAALEKTSISPTVGTWYQLEVEWTTADEITVSLLTASGDIVGTASATDSSFQSGGAGYFTNPGSAGSASMFYDSSHLVDGDVSSAVYLGGPMEVDDVDSGWINLSSLSDASAQITWQHSLDGGSWTNVSSTTHTTSGNFSTSEPLSGSGMWRVRVDVSVTGSDPMASIADDGILFTNQAPEVTSPGPTGTIHTNEPDFSVYVDDPTFGKAQGESVSLRWYVDGELRHTTPVSNPSKVGWHPTISSGNHTWHVVAEDQYGTTTTLADQQISVEHFAPTITNATPADGAQLTERKTTFSVTVSDGDVAYDGDTLTGTVFVDGESVGSSSRSSNGTITVNETIGSGGEHSYHWEVSDSYGKSDSMAARTVSIPSEIRIYNESAPTELVDGASVKIQMYVDESGSPEVFVRNTSDGKVNMTGLPASKPFVAVADADGYSTRRIFVPSLYESQSLYLLPSGAEKVDTIFKIADYTGDFPSESTVLLVQRSLNGSYQTVAGDYFGASGQFPTQLAYQERHRLVLMNVETGERRVLGTYTPLASQTATVRVSPNGRVEQMNTSNSVTIQPSTTRLPALNGTTLQFAIPKSSGPWRATASTSTATLLNSSVESGVSSRTVDLRGYAGETLTVSVTRNGTVVATTDYTISETTSTPTLLSSLSSLTQQIPAPNRGAFTGFIAVMTTVFVMGAVGGLRTSGAAVGVTGVLVLAGFSTIGWVGYDLVFVAGVALVAFGGLRRGL